MVAKISMCLVCAILSGFQRIVIADILAFVLVAVHSALSRTLFRICFALFAVL